VLYRATAEMLGDRWLLGWGAGSFRHAFPLYAQTHPEIYDSSYAGRKRWEHAHSDILQTPLELGVPLAAAIAVALGCTLRTLSRRIRASADPIPRALALGCALVLAHSAVDFVFQNHAVLLTWSVLLLAALRWTEFDPHSAAPPLSPRENLSGTTT
jgi:O-antigen ligase